MVQRHALQEHRDEENPTVRTAPHLLLNVDDVHSLQTDPHTHCLTPSTLQQALSWFIYLTHKERTPERRRGKERDRQYKTHRQTVCVYICMHTCACVLTRNRAECGRC